MSDHTCEAIFINTVPSKHTFDLCLRFKDGEGEWRSILSVPALGLLVFMFASFFFPQQKNHTGRNASVKAHKNGIKKAKSYPAQSLKGVSV